MFTIWEIQETGMIRVFTVLAHLFTFFLLIRLFGLDMI